MTRTIATFAAILLAAAGVIAQETPIVVQASDAAAVEAAKDKAVTLVGKVSKAEWSGTGKVLNVEFEGATNVVAAAFEKSRAKLDEAFVGDFAKAITGSTVRLSGVLIPYGGRTESLKDHLQIIISDSSQVTVAVPGTAVTPANP